jgi:hypothetical protein
MLSPQISTKVQFGKRQALDVTGHASEGLVTKANPPTSITITPVRHTQSSSSYVLNGHINGSPATLLIDTGSVISLVQTDLWKRIDPNCEKLKPYTGPSLVGMPENLTRGLASHRFYTGWYVSIHLSHVSHRPVARRCHSWPRFS